MEPSMYTSEPLRRYCPQISARRDQATMCCHSVRSCFLPLLSVNFSSVAMVNLATVVPPGVDLISGSFPRRPTRMSFFFIAASPSLLSEDNPARAAGAPRRPRLWFSKCRRFGGDLLLVDSARHEVRHPARPPRLGFG